MITSPAIIVLMSLLALSIERPMDGYNYAVPDNPLVLPKRRTTTSKPEEGPYSYPVPEDPLILQRNKNVTIEAEQKQELTTTTETTYQYPVPENPLQLPKDLPICGGGGRHPIDIRTDPLFEGESPDVPGVTCKPSEKQEEVVTTTTTAAYQYPVPEHPLQLPTKDRQIKLIDDEDFQINFEELPDFNPEDFPDLVEAERSDLQGLRAASDGLPAPLTTPQPTRVRKVIAVLEPVLVKSCLDMKDELPHPGVNCIEAIEDDSGLHELATVVSEELAYFANEEEEAQQQAHPLPILGIDFNLALFPSDDPRATPRIIPRKK